MSAKVDEVPIVETHERHSATESASTSVDSLKVSMFKGKVGFVIPKNKFSGSLVPIVKGGKKSESSNAANEEGNKLVQRKTKWGPDLTQDASVRKGRALAYQTRLDQITRQLGLGSLTGGDEISKSAGDVRDTKPSTTHIDYEKLQALEFEKREAIGEILKLNPSFKAPPDYRPVTREAIVSIPVKEHPEHDFVGLIFGVDGDTHKRLEKETGTKIQVFGTKSETEEQVEIVASDRIGLLSSFDDAYIQISADTYEQVDAAAALIELLLSSALGKSATSKASVSASGDSLLVSSQDLTTAPVVNTATTSHELIRPIIRSVSTTSHVPFQPYPGSWFQTMQSNMPFGLAPTPSSTAFTFSPSPSHLVVRPRHASPYGFGSPPQNIPVGPARIHPPVQAMQGQFVNPAYPLGQAGPPRNHSVVTSATPLVGQPPTAIGSPNVPASQLAERPLVPTVSSPGYAVLHAGGPRSLASGSLVPPIGSAQGSIVSQPVASLPAPQSSLSATSQAFPSQIGPTSSTFVLPQFQSSSAMPLQLFAPQTPLTIPSTNAALRSAQSPVPPPHLSHLPQSGMPLAVGASKAPSFTPLKSMDGTAPRPPGPHPPGSGDFTFKPHRPQGPHQSVPRPGVLFSSQRPPSVQLSPSEAASFRPTLQNMIPQNIRQGFPRAQVPNQIGAPANQFRPASPNLHVGPRNLGPVPPMPNAAGPFPPRMGHSAQYQQSYPAPAVGRPAGRFVLNQHSSPFSRSEVYDPFSPTSVPSQGSNITITRKQESDPEYEDLMASVGVK